MTISQKTTTGAISGCMAHYVTQMTGPKVALHEIVGHGYLGFHLTGTFASGEEPKYVIYPFERIKKMFHTRSFVEFKQALWKLVTAPLTGGAGGYTTAKWGKPNALFDSFDKRLAWISVAGSIPGLVVNSLTVAGGVKLREKHEGLGTALLTYGLLEHLVESAYPLHAALMDREQLATNALYGHDFANFAIRLEKVTGISAQALAIGTAIAWTAFVPAIALGMYLYLNSQKTKKTLVAYHPPDQVEKGLKVASLVGGGLTCTTKVIRIFADTIFPNLAPAAAVLAYATPLLSSIAVLTNGYETYKDMKSAIPVSAKVISVAKLVISVASSVALVIGIFVPGINTILIVGIVLGSAGTVVLGFAKYQIVKKYFLNLPQRLIVRH